MREGYRMTLSKNTIASSICLIGSIVMSIIIASMYDVQVMIGYIVAYISSFFIGIASTFIGWRDFLSYTLWMFLFFVVGFVLIFWQAYSFRCSGKQQGAPILGRNWLIAPMSATGRFAKEAPGPELDMP